MDKIDLFFRIFLPAFIVFYLVVLYYFNIKQFKRKYKVDPRVVQKSDRVMYKLERYRDTIFILLIVNIVIYSFIPKIYFVLVPIEYLDHNILKFAGILVLIGSLALTRVSQIHLKQAWRIGIDRSETEGDLITSGIYSISRNPIALGMLMSTIGIFMITPNLITFTTIFLVHLIFSIRIILEEEHLSKLHGNHYDLYKKKTSRWL